MSRVSINWIPNDPCECKVDGACVYRSYQSCDEPRVNKSNSDSLCHNISNKDLLPQLKKIAKRVNCPVCDGDGMVEYLTKPCERCFSTGEVIIQ
jgi:DnaJ-class molecular chaperone